MLFIHINYILTSQIIKNMINYVALYKKFVPVFKKKQLILKDTNFINKKFYCYNNYHFMLYPLIIKFYNF